MRRPREPIQSVSVLVVDATVMACELLASALSRTSKMKVVGWEVDSAAALATATRIKTDVALISSNLQDGPGKGLSLASQLRTKRPDIRSVILLDRADRRGIVDAFRAGARGVLSRGAGLSALPKCVHRVSLFENIQNAMRGGLGEVKLVETEVVLDPGFHRLATFRRRIKAQPELPILIVGPADDAGNVELRGSGNGK
jgi:DNA-binding NarL/FixJ family response regulator